MRKMWDRLSILSQYYLKSILSFFFFWGLLSILKIDFVNIVLFVMSFVWHFTLLTPGLKEKMMTSKQRFSFLSVVIRINYYLQLFIKINKYSFGPSVIRAISPLLFACLLKVVGGNGNILFTILGSICFEITHYWLNKKIAIMPTSVPTGDQEIPPAIPNAENSHE